MSTFSWPGRKYSSEGVLLENNSFQRYFWTIQHPAVQETEKTPHVESSMRTWLIQTSFINLHPSWSCSSAFTFPGEHWADVPQTNKSALFSTAAPTHLAEAQKLCGAAWHSRDFPWELFLQLSTPRGAREAAVNSLPEPLSQTHCFDNLLKVATSCSHLLGQGGSWHFYEKPLVLPHKKPRAPLL